MKQALLKTRPEIVEAYDGLPSGLMRVDILSSTILASVAFPEAPRVGMITVSPDDTRVAMSVTHEAFGDINIYTFADNALHLLASDQRVGPSITYSPDGTFLWTSAFGGLDVFHASSGEHVRTVRQPLMDLKRDDTSCIAFSPNGEFVATTGHNDAICIWRIHSDMKDCQTFSTNSHGISAGLFVFR